MPAIKAGKDTKKNVCHYFFNNINDTPSLVLQNSMWCPIRLLLIDYSP